MTPPDKPDPDLDTDDVEELLDRAAAGDRQARRALLGAQRAGHLSPQQRARLEALQASSTPTDGGEPDWRAGLLQPDFWLDYDPRDPPDEGP